jgi:hypothetical protein
VNFKIFEAQLDAILIAYSEIQKRARYDDLSDIPSEDRQSLVTRGIATIERIAGRNSTYAKEVARLLVKWPHLHIHTPYILGVVQALRDDVREGYLTSVVSLAHGEIFADFFEMAEHLHDSGYKDAAAVISGSALEAHLRALCSKHDISVDETKGDGTSVPKKADRINNDLAGANVYSKLDQKNITAWLDLRNKAAHGRYTEYTAEQVALVLSASRDFIARNPA